MHKTTLYLSEDLQRDLLRVAKRSGRSQSDLVREALVAFLREQPRQLPQSIGIVEDSEFRGRDSEAWLDAEWGPP